MAKGKSGKSGGSQGFKSGNFKPTVPPKDPAKPDVGGNGPKKKGK